ADAHSVMTWHPLHTWKRDVSSAPGSPFSDAIGLTATPCVFASARAQLANGWRLELTPRGESEGVVKVEVNWQRVKSADAVPTSRLLTLKRGESVPLDYISTPAGGRGTCDAVGLLLRVGINGEAPAPR